MAGAPDILKPDLDLLRKEYVLVQAWKKTSNYIRYHNWYADTLELDWITVNLPEFIAGISESLESPDQWVSEPIRLVPAPKNQRWQVKDGDWRPERGITQAHLRPLAYVSPRDQVVATALMLCVADRIETRQGDPRQKPLQHEMESRIAVSSYGNRLFCDESKKDGKLRHRWGSSKLYRSYFQDYRSFIRRPSAVAELAKQNGRRVFIIESDLRQFYDRVRPRRLMHAFREYQRKTKEEAFFNFAGKVLDWRWDHRDLRDVEAHEESAGLEDFKHIALPQGLVSAGFFANVILIKFDEALREKIGEDIEEDIRLEDACRYVDDLRIVVSANQSIDGLQDTVSGWLQGLLDNKAPGLLLSRDKTKVAEFGGSQRPLVFQSRKMEQIQSAVSGGFDAITGAEILDAVQGLVHTQESLNRDSDADWRFAPLSDVRDETVVRFAAGRFRTTYRSIRPLLDVNKVTDETTEIGLEVTDNESDIPRLRTKLEHDNEARVFALRLIGRWIVNPSNVRLLRIGLDIWPDTDVLKYLLDLLKPFTQQGRRRGMGRRVAWYCLAEILKAGATETGFVNDEESLSGNINLQEYRSILRDEAIRLVKLRPSAIPWYLKQQALLFLAVFDSATAPIARQAGVAETENYWKLIRFLRGKWDQLSDDEFATLAVLQRRGFRFADTPELDIGAMPVERRQEIAVRDPSYALELAGDDSTFFDDLPVCIRNDNCVFSDSADTGHHNLAELARGDSARHPLRNELSLLRFAAAFVTKLKDSEADLVECITPSQVQFKMKLSAGIAEAIELEFLASQDTRYGLALCNSQLVRVG